MGTAWRTRLHTIGLTDAETAQAMLLIIELPEKRQQMAVDFLSGPGSDRVHTLFVRGLLEKGMIRSRTTQQP